jgi:hypothetical protein
MIWGIASIAEEENIFLIRLVADGTWGGLFIF